jgi:hypothetical protein
MFHSRDRYVLGYSTVHNEIEGSCYKRIGHTERRKHCTIAVETWRCIENQTRHKRATV